MNMANEAQDALRAELPYSHAFIRASVSASRATLRGVVEWCYQKEQAKRRSRGVVATDEGRAPAHPRQRARLGRAAQRLAFKQPFFVRVVTRGRRESR